MYSQPVLQTIIYFTRIESENFDFENNPALLPWYCMVVPLVLTTLFNPKALNFVCINHGNPLVSMIYTNKIFEITINVLFSYRLQSIPALPGLRPQ